MIILCLMIIGVILVSLITSLMIGYLYVKLIFLIGERYAPYFRNKSDNTSGDERQYTCESINFIIFLKCIANTLHLPYIQSIFWYPFRIHKMNTKVDTIHANKKGESYQKDYEGNPKGFLHDKKLAHDSCGVNHKQTEPSTEIYEYFKNFCGNLGKLR